MAIEPFDRDGHEERGRERRRLVPRARGQRELAEFAAHEIDLPLPPETWDTADDELSLREQWQVLAKHRWTVLGCTLLVAVVALVASLLATPLYRSAARVQIESAPLRILQVEGVETVGGGGGVEFIGTQIELIKSRAVAQRAVRQMGLVGDEQFQSVMTQKGGMAGLLGLVRGEPERQTPAPLEEREAEAVDYLLELRDARKVRGSNLVEVSVVSPDPALAARLANGLAAAFIDANLGRKEDNLQFARSFLEDQLQQLKLKLEESEKALIRFAQEQKLASVDQNTSLVATNLQQLNVVLGEATAERIRAESRWQHARTSSGTSLEALKSPVLDKLLETRVTLKGEYESLRATFKPDYPALQQLERRIKEVEQRIREEADRYAEAAQAEFQAALSNERLLRAQVDALQGELLDLQGRGVQYNILKREADTNRELYNGLLQRYKEIGVAGDVNASNLSIVDAALAGRHFKPNVTLNVLIGVLVGLVLGVGLAFLSERFEDTLKTPEDVERHLRLPVVGVVPKVHAGIVEASAEDSRSAFSEAYRSLRTGLQYSTQDGAPRALLVTSSMAGEGKSTTSLMLARKFAQLGMKVLLIDADMRKPSLHKRLAISNENGLSDYLAGLVDGPAVFKASEFENLTVVTAGESPPNPSELLAAARFRSLLTMTSQSYGQVIIDAPPLLGLADVPIIANAADGTLLVIEAGRGRIGAVRGALKRLLAVRARVIGTVLVKYDARAAGYGYGYGYGYADAYYYHADGGSGDDSRARRRLGRA